MQTSGSWIDFFDLWVAALLVFGNSLIVWIVLYNLLRPDMILKLYSVASYTNLSCEAQPNNLNSLLFYSVVKVLLAANADVEIANFEGNTPLLRYAEMLCF